MEGIGSEVSHKIRAAIKAKLIELGAYIDDELPDYIMVMVANKRSRHQMDEDLQLFLGSNTKTFTSWLHTVLQKLQEVTVANFDLKKESQEKKSGGRRKSDETSEDNNRKERKSSEDKSKTSKKHSRKHKEGKKLKKGKHKSKDKEKLKSQDKRQVKNGTDEERREDEHDINCNVSPNGDKMINKDVKQGVKLESASSTTAYRSSENVDKFKNFRMEKDDSSSKSNTPSHFTEEPTKTKSGSKSGEKNMEEESKCEIQIDDDDFNIEPLEPNETKRNAGIEKTQDNGQDSKGESQSTAWICSGMRVKAPTRELLKEHDKILSETEDNASRNIRTSDKDSEESLSPEEIRKQLLLSRAKKKLEQSKLADRMKSNSPDVQVVESNSVDKQDDRSALRFSSSSKNQASRRVDYDDEDDGTRGRGSSNRNQDVARSSDFEGKKISLRKGDCEEDENRNKSSGKSETRKNVISISKSLEMEKNLGVKWEKEKKSKEVSSSRKRPLPSRVVTIPEPGAPEIPSIVKVKPREFVSKDKQANKVLILKAVADAEKSIISVNSRNESDIEMKKSEALFTKNLRGKRYEKLAVTLSNVGGSAIDREKSKRMVSVDSENTHAIDRKTESLKDSEVSQGFRSVPELTLKNISNKSEDQFISSKTSAMEKNDKYIHCWLEGVEKAVKDDEIVNPSEMDDFQGHFSDEGKEDVGFVNEEEQNRKKDPGVSVESSQAKKWGEKSSTKNNQDDGPQIVVTLDGLTSKAIKDIILRNRELPNGPLTAKKTDKGKESKDGKRGGGGGDDDEKASKVIYKSNDSSKNAGTSRFSDKEGGGAGFEKISERFGRINKTNEVHEYKEKYYEFERERYEKKCLKYQGTDKEKHYEKLKDKYASAGGESKNKLLIAQLSEKFGKVDREFQNKKRKYDDDEGRYSYSSSRRIDRSIDRDGKHRKLDRKSIRSGERRYGR